MSYYQPTWKRDALELLDFIRKHDQGAGLTMPELRKATGESKARLELMLGWLAENGALVRVDDPRFRRWVAVLEDDVAVEVAPMDEDILRELAGL